MLRGKKLTLEVYELINKNWPIHPSDICRLLEIKTNSSNISKIKYHFDLLEEQEKISTKKIDRALVAWPLEIEKLRLMQELMK
ncbi:hypothetical protein GF327_06235 [Candidatus Woesearchaeota archaeon]|nr:hypothetical protein [Candidatus Woesearchaeota archaeon]